MRIIFFLLFNLSLFAHPHIFIDTFIDVKKDKLTISWVYDTMNSTMWLADYDKNKNNTLEPTEIITIYNDDFQTYKDLEFFTYLFDGKTKLTTPKPEDFHALVNKEGRLVYQFSLPRPDHATGIEFFDSDLFIAFMVKDEFVQTSEKFSIRDVDYDTHFTYRLELPKP
jgi:ABC-type uncharacterized transport system substrate-binding protein